MRSSAHRKAASVLPEPVGAEMRTCSPVAIAGQAWAWAGVGSSKELRNQSRTRGVKAERGMCDLSRYDPRGSWMRSGTRGGVVRATCHGRRAVLRRRPQAEADAGARAQRPDELQSRRLDVPRA